MAGIGGGSVLRGFNIYGWQKACALDDEGEKRAQRRDACRNDAHAGFGGGPDARVDKIPCYVKVCEARKDHNTDYGDNADTRTLLAISRS